LLEAAETEVTDLDDTQEFEAAWQRAVDAALQEYDEHQIDDKYKEMVDQIREEMGSLVPQSSPLPESGHASTQEREPKV
jgi:hypothetical protein